MTPDDLLDQLETDLRASDHETWGPGTDRRQFVFRTLVAAAAGYFGSPSALRAQQPSAAASPPPPPTVPVALGNGEPPALQFQPYPAGTGALMERLMRERGPAAFRRTAYTTALWRGEVPASDEDIAFLPAHRLAA